MANYPTVKQLFPQKVKRAEVSRSDIAASIKEFAKLLGRGADVGRLQILLLGAQGERTGFVFDVLAGDCRVEEATTTDPTNLRMVVTEETWTDIANGDLSPVDAFRAGRMELAGDLTFAKRQYAKVSSRGQTPELPF